MSTANIPTSTSPRDASFVLRNVFTPVVAPNVTIPLPLEFPPATIPTCFGGGCFSFPLDPREDLLRGWPEPDWFGRMGEAVLGWERNGRLELVSPRGRAVDVTHAFGDDLRTALLARQLRVLSPVESGERVARVGARAGSPTLAVLPKHFPDAGVPDTIVDRNGVLTGPVIAVPPDGRAAALSVGQDDAIAPAARDDYLAVFSAVDSIVWLAGGRDAANSRGRRTIWRYSLTGGGWESRFDHGELSAGREMLSLAYDSVRHSVYLLDVVREAVGKRGRRQREMVRLLRLDDFTGEVTELLRVPRTRAFEHLAVTVLSDGTLALTAGLGPSTWIWRLGVTGNSAKHLGLRVEVARLISEPFMGRKDALVPVFDLKRKVRYLALSPTSFKAGPACDAL